MRFIDANVFLYALIKPKRELSHSEQTVKKQARKILESLDSNGKVLTTTVHISEVFNILESHSTYDYTFEVAERLLFNDNIIIESVNKENYRISLLMAKKHNISINDALAVFFMRNNKVKEIYSFDKHFDNIEDIKRVVD